ncbi:MAG: efflux RND transporter periplasmic adaptor subunit [Maricaulaceae bacterium]|jgi:membrane fusion protein (multidrug efflux system)
MSRYAFVIVAGIVGVLLALAAAVKIISNNAEEAQASWGQQALPVRVAEVERAQFADIVEALGTARANESVTITSKVTDVISRIAFESGDHVHAGDVLAELADAEEAATLTEARSTYDEALRERDRYRELESRGVATSQRLDELDSALDRAAARVRSIEARLSDRIVRAPFDGVVGLRNASPGMLVRPGDVIATLDDISVIKLDFTVPERFLAAVEPGAPLEARAAAFEDDVFVGEVDQLDSRVDPITRTATARAIVENPEGRLLPGMLLVVELSRDARESFAVPELAVFLEGEQAYLYVVESGERGAMVVKRAVDAGARRDGLIEIIAGLDPDDLVVQEGTHRLRDGAPVTVVNPPGGAGAAGDGGEDVARSRGGAEARGFVRSGGE